MAASSLIVRFSELHTNSARMAEDRKRLPMANSTLAPAAAAERTYEWAKADVHHWLSADTEAAAKADVHHWLTADHTYEWAKADVHHWLSADAGVSFSDN
jgi:hypothetical protein